MTFPAITLIAAIARNGVIGRETGGIPWHLPRDIAHFRRYTQHHHLLVGRRTYEEMTGWFKERTPLVLTRQPDYPVQDGHAVRTLSEALEQVRAAGENELIVIGGAEVFALTLPEANRLVLTWIDAWIEGACRFPDLSPHGPWIETQRKHYDPDPENAYAMDFVTLEKIRKT